MKYLPKWTISEHFTIYDEFGYAYICFNPLEWYRMTRSGNKMTKCSKKKVEELNYALDVLKDTVE